MEKIRDFLDKYQDLWWKTELNDVVMDFVDNVDDCYCYDMRGNKKMLHLFFPGTHDYMYAIWVGDHDIKDYDKLPVYVIDYDFDMDENNYRTYRCKGNFRTFMTNQINNFLKTTTPLLRKEYNYEANKALKELQDFSTELLKDCDYVLEPYKCE